MIFEICFFCGLPITREGKDGDSLCMHHILYKPEFKIPSHCSCHRAFHKMVEAGYDFVDSFRYISDGRFLERKWNNIPLYLRSKIKDVISIGDYFEACRKARGV